MVKNKLYERGELLHEVLYDQAGGQGDGPPNLDRNPNVKPREQFLPARYNVNTELEITVEPGSGGRITRDFELTE